jgi:hypothetical protein
METKIRRFLEFNGKAILFLNNDGQYWVAIRPICEALGIEYINEFKRIKRHRILGQFLYKQKMVAADNKLRYMITLPEKYIYGWLFSINSKSEVFLEYRLECYNLIYEYFHEILIKRHFQLCEKSEIENKISALKDKLNENIDYLMLQQLTAKKVNRQNPETT